MTVPFNYQQIHYVVLGTPKLEESIGFYQDLMGLELAKHEANNYAAFRCSDYVANFILRQHDTAGLLRIGLLVQSAADLDQARAHFERLNYDITTMSPADTAQFDIGPSFSVLEPHSGITFDFFSAMLEPALPFKPTLTKIQRLGHAVVRLADPNFESAWKALSEDFNFVPSDYVDGKAVWMRCYPNPFHHSFAIVRDEQPGLHHINFMVTELDDVGKAHNRLVAAGVPIVFGPGRHKPSGSIFLYFTDPAGMTMEFSFGMEEFPAEGAREPRKLENSLGTMDIWGGAPKPTFAKGGEILKP